MKADIALYLSVAFDTRPERRLNQHARFRLRAARKRKETFGLKSCVLPNKAATGFSVMDSGGDSH